MRLYFIRHGQSLNNALYEEGREQERVYDPHLTDIGQEQAQLVARYLADGIDMPGKLREAFQLTHLYCSAMTRAMQTALVSVITGEQTAEEATAEVIAQLSD